MCSLGSTRGGYCVWLLVKIEEQHGTFIPSDSHRGFYFPPFAKANGPPLSSERKTSVCFPFVQLFPSCPFNIYENIFLFAPDNQLRLKPIVGKSLENVKESDRNSKHGLFLIPYPILFVCAMFISFAHFLSYGKH